MKPIIFIDNFDSFVHNLMDEFSRCGAPVEVYRADWSLTEALKTIAEKKPQALVLSPGPSSPREAILSMNLLAHVPMDLPILGVCLGHQCMVEQLGGVVSKAERVVHGQASSITHNEQLLFAGLSNPLQVGRYHSLIATKVPDSLVVDATVDGIVMAVHHKTRPWYGVQFHPESVLTPEGPRLIRNFLRLIA